MKYYITSKPHHPEPDIKKPKESTPPNNKKTESVNTTELNVNSDFTDWLNVDFTNAGYSEIAFNAISWLETDWPDLTKPTTPALSASEIINYEAYVEENVDSLYTTRTGNHWLPLLCDTLQNPCIIIRNIFFSLLKNNMAFSHCQLIPEDKNYFTVNYDSAGVWYSFRCEATSAVEETINILFSVVIQYADVLPNKIKVESANCAIHIRALKSQKDTLDKFLQQIPSNSEHTKYDLAFASNFMFRTFSFLTANKIMGITMPTNIINPENPLYKQLTFDLKRGFELKDIKHNGNTRYCKNPTSVNEFIDFFQLHSVLFPRQRALYFLPQGKNNPAIYFVIIFENLIKQRLLSSLSKIVGEEYIHTAMSSNTSRFTIIKQDNKFLLQLRRSYKCKMILEIQIPLPIIDPHAFENKEDYQVTINFCNDNLTFNPSYLSDRYVTRSVKLMMEKVMANDHLSTAVAERSHTGWRPTYIPANHISTVCKKTPAHSSYPY